MKPSLWIRGSPSFIFRPPSLQEKVDSRKKLAAVFPHVLQEFKSQSRCFLNKVQRKRSAFFFPCSQIIWIQTSWNLPETGWMEFCGLPFHYFHVKFSLSNFLQPCAFYLSCKGIYFCLANLNCSIALLPTGDKYTPSSVSSLSAGGLMGVKEELGSARQGRNSSY